MFFLLQVTSAAEILRGFLIQIPNLGSTFEVSLSAESIQMLECFQEIAKRTPTAQVVLQTAAIVALG